MDWLDEHRKAGRIGAFGGSNWSVARAQEAYEYSMCVGVKGFAATSNYFGLARANEDMWPGVELINTDDKQWYEQTGTEILPGRRWDEDILQVEAKGKTQMKM